MFAHKIYAVFFFAGIFLAGLAMSASAQQEPEIIQRAENEGWKNPLAERDLNQDGDITVDEALDEAESRFDKYDRNRDGKIEVDEMVKYFEDLRDEQPRAFGEDQSYKTMLSSFVSHMGRFDANGDGVISQNEYLVPRMGSLASFDLDKDSRVTDKEMRAVTTFASLSPAQREKVVINSRPPPAPDGKNVMPPLHLVTSGTPPPSQTRSLRSQPSDVTSSSVQRRQRRSSSARSTRQQASPSDKVDRQGANPLGDMTPKPIFIE